MDESLTEALAKGCGTYDLGFIRFEVCLAALPADNKFNWVSCCMAGPSTFFRSPSHLRPMNQFDVAVADPIFYRTLWDVYLGFQAASEWLKEQREKTAAGKFDEDGVGKVLSALFGGFSKAKMDAGYSPLLCKHAATYGLDVTNVHFTLAPLHAVKTVCERLWFCTLDYGGSPSVWALDALGQPVVCVAKGGKTIATALITTRTTTVAGRTFQYGFMGANWEQVFAQVGAVFEYDVPQYELAASELFALAIKFFKPRILPTGGWLVAQYLLTAVAGLYVEMRRPTIRDSHKLGQLAFFALSNLLTPMRRTLGLPGIASLGEAAAEGYFARFNRAARRSSKQSNVIFQAEVRLAHDEDHSSKTRAAGKTDAPMPLIVLRLPHCVLTANSRVKVSFDALRNDNLACADERIFLRDGPDGSLDISTISFGGLEAPELPAGCVLHVACACHDQRHRQWPSTPLRRLPPDAPAVAGLSLGGGQSSTGARAAAGGARGGGAAVDTSGASGGATGATSEAGGGGGSSTGGAGSSRTSEAELTVTVDIKRLRTDPAAASSVTVPQGKGAVVFIKSKAAFEGTAQILSTDEAFSQSGLRLVGGEGGGTLSIPAGLCGVLHLTCVAPCSATLEIRDIDGNVAQTAVLKGGKADGSLIHPLCQEAEDIFEQKPTEKQPSYIKRLLQDGEARKLARTMNESSDTISRSKDPPLVFGPLTLRVAEAGECAGRDAGSPMPKGHRKAATRGCIAQCCKACCEGTFGVACAAHSSGGSKSAAKQSAKPAAAAGKAAAGKKAATAAAPAGAGPKRKAEAEPTASKKAMNARPDRYGAGSDEWRPGRGA